jgi:cold shock CspA family protein/ribosome-associated translation inhibitor RaiA
MQIHWRNLPLAPHARARIEERLRALAAGRDDLIELHISGKQSAHHVHGAQEVSVRSHARGREIVATRTRPDLGVALDEALGAFERELRRVRERDREPRGPGAAAGLELGVIDRVELERGHGFILTDAGERVYFHRNALRPGLRFEALEEGQRVALNFEGGEKGLQATVVAAPPPDAPPV